MDDAKLFRELEIIGSLMPLEVPPGTRVGNGQAVIEQCVPADRVVAAIDDAERDGVRSLLLVVSGEGGSLEAGCKVYNRLRRFSEAGGFTAAFVQGRCASTLPVVVEAADLVLMRADAKLIMHSAHGQPGTDIADANETVAALLHERTGFPLERLRAYLADVYVLCELHDQAALHAGWADAAPMTIELARSWARLLGQGVSPADFGTARAARLAAAKPSRTAPIPAAEACAHMVQSSESGFISRPWVSTDEAASKLALRNWTARTIPSGDWYSVAFGPGRWVAVGNGVCATSENGIAWASRTIPAGNYRGVAWNGSLFVAVGVSACATSADGITWTSRTIPVGTYYSATWHEPAGYWVAVGTKFARSSNGTTWTDEGTPSASLYDVASDGIGMLVAVGSSSTAYSSADGGDTWTARTIPAGEWNSVAAGNGTFCAVGQAEGDNPEANCATSTDGITWTERSVLTGVANRPMMSVAWTGHLFAAVTYTNLANAASVFTSPTGASWDVSSEGLPNADGYWALGWSGRCMVAVAPGTVCASSAITA